MSKKSTNKQRIKALETEMNELKEMLKFLVSSDKLQVKLRIDPKENEVWVNQLRDTESKYSLKAG